MFILLTILPLTMLSLLFFPSNCKQLSLFGSILNFIQILFLFESFDLSSSRFQFIFLGLFGLDGLSLILLLLVGFLLPIILLNLSSPNNFKLFLILSISYFSMLTFLSLDFFIFYIGYEILLIPMYFFIGLFGSRNRKITALFEFYLYTLFGSFFLLFVILFLYFELGSTSYIILSSHLIHPLKQSFLFILLFFAFGVKIPLIPFHIWLPEAHVEAPTSISIYLAAILLKLGGYGFLRFSLSLFPLAASNSLFLSVIFTFSILGLFYSSIACLTLWDIKKFIAYSSIGHMNLSLLALFSNNLYGFYGSIYFMFSHGLISSALFILIGILYDRYHSRTLKYFKGLVLFLPLFSFFFGFFTFANVAFPLTSGYLSELFTFIAIFLYNPAIGFLSTFALLLTPFYALWLFHKISFGSFSSYLSPSFDLSLRDFHSLFPLFFFTLFIGICPNLILCLL